jgi:hypothetical protein
MAIGFDKLTSEWDPTQALGGIADRLEVGRLRDVRQKSLADIDINSAASLIAAGKKLIDAGDFEGGTKLFAEGRQLKQAETAAFANTIYQQYVDKLKNQPDIPVAPGPLRAAPGAPTTDNRDPFTYGPVAPEGAAPGGDSVFGKPPVPGTGSVIPPGTLGPRTEAPAPEEPSELVGRYKLAGPPDIAPPTSALAPPAGGLPSWATPGGLAPVPGAKAGGEASPELPPPIPVPADRGASAAWDEFQARARRVMMIPGHKLAAPALAAEIELMRSARNRANVDKETGDWWDYNMDRMKERLPPVSKENFRVREATSKERFAEGEKLYTTIMADRHKAAKMLPILDQLESLVNNPSWATVGPGSELFSHGKKVLRNAADALIELGVPISKDFRDSIEHMTKTTQIQEAYKAVAGSSVLERLGSLSRTTDRDVEFINDISPSLKLSKEGNKMVIQFYRELVKRGMALGDTVHEVRRAFEDKGRQFSAFEVNDAIIRQERERPTDVLKNPDGSLTPFGQQMQEEAERNAGRKPGFGKTPLETTEKRIGIPFKGAFDFGYGVGEAIPGAVRDLAANLKRGFTPRPEVGAPVGGGAGAAPPGRMPTITGPDGKKYIWGPSGLTPVE